MSEKFELGQEVEWISQAGGHFKKKNGVIVDIIPAGKRPNRNNYLDLHKGAGVGLSRRHESYVVAVRVGRNSVKHYWPIVSALKWMEAKGEK